jgi:hypothetical protein
MRKFILCIILLLYALTVAAQENETVQSVVNITGNVPTTTVLLDEAGEDGSDNSILLVENSTQLLSCWGVADDLDGISDLADVTAVIYAESSTRQASDNQSIHYTNTSCDTSTISLDGQWNCTFNVQYFSENSTWTCAVNVTNQDPTYYNDTANDTAVIEDFVALEIHNATLDFGLRAVDTNSTANTSMQIYNTGNVNLDIRLDAFNRSSVFTDDDTTSFNCTYGTIPVNYLRFSLTQGTDFASSVPMQAVGSTATQNFNLENREGGGTVLPTFDSVYWAIGIPNNVAGICTGQIMVIGEVG